MENIPELFGLVTSCDCPGYDSLPHWPHLVHRGRDEVECSTAFLRRRCCSLLTCRPHPFFLWVRHPLGKGEEVLRALFSFHGRAPSAQPRQVTLRRPLRWHRQQEHLDQVSPQSPPHSLGRQAAISSDDTQHVRCCVYLVARAIPPGTASAVQRHCTSCVAKSLEPNACCRKIVQRHPHVVHPVTLTLTP